jgi:DNA topoisomerase-3
MRTRRAFKAYLAWDPEAGKVAFQFEPRTSKYPPRKTTAAKTVAKKAAKTAAKTAKPVREKKPRAPSAGLAPSAALAAVIGSEPVARTEVIKKLWDYIKAQGLQDAANKRAINADAKLREVFGKDQVTMFELAGIVGKHLS